MNDTKEYRIFQNMMLHYKEVQLEKSCTDPSNELFFFLTKSLAQTQAANPIPCDAPGHNDYDDIMYFFDAWPKDKADCAFKKRMLLAAYNLCNACDYNIFDTIYNPSTDISLEALQEKEYETTEQEDIDSGTYIPVEEPKYEHMFGVVPFTDDEENNDDE